MANNRIMQVYTPAGNHPPVYGLPRAGKRQQSCTGHTVQEHTLYTHGKYGGAGVFIHGHPWPQSISNTQMPVRTSHNTSALASPNPEVNVSLCQPPQQGRPRTG